MSVSMTANSTGDDRLNASFRMEAVDDDALVRIAGGQQYVFLGDSFRRDSWFVTFMTKLMIQGSVRQELSRPLDAVPQDLTVEGRRYRVWQLGETVYVESAE
ncbi:MAG: hypothetical protein K6F56_07510 [Oscillospiraceae bacterium]|nr:hypothetical protein [Oscillospiraceae bacterium]